MARMRSKTNGQAPIVLPVLPGLLDCQAAAGLERAGKGPEAAKMDSAQRLALARAAPPEGRRLRLLIAWMLHRKTIGIPINGCFRVLVWPLHHCLARQGQSRAICLCRLHTDAALVAALLTNHSVPPVSPRTEACRRSLWWSLDLRPTRPRSTARRRS